MPDSLLLNAVDSRTLLLPGVCQEGERTVTIEVDTHMGEQFGSGKPIVAIIGRQNVGKSTFLNRVAGKRIAIVEDLPGTTRDRIFVSLSWQEREFLMVDTGGLEPEPQTAIAQAVKEQAEIAISEADVIIFLVDAKDGVTPTDQDIADLLRRANKPVVLVANKADNPDLEMRAVEFYQLGLGEPLAISAYHGRGVEELLDKIVSLLTARPLVETQPEMMKVAIVGRPNVGKSMLLNALLGQERVIVSETPGTTRDAVDTVLDFQGQSVIFIDTAGIRQPGQWGIGLERYSVVRSLQAIDRADVALLVMDASEGVTAQDKHIAGYIQQAAKGIVLIVNKWDLVEAKNIAEWNRYIKSEFKFVPYAPTLYVSAKLGQGINKLMSQAYQVYQERTKQLSPAVVNSVIQQAVASHLPQVGGKPIRIRDASQTGVNPPTFVFHVSNPKVHFSYRRYLENKLRQTFGFTGTPLRLIFKTGGKA